MAALLPPVEEELVAVVEVRAPEHEGVLDPHQGLVPHPELGQHREEGRKVLGPRRGCDVEHRPRCVS